MRQLNPFSPFEPEDPGMQEDPAAPPFRTDSPFDQAPFAAPVPAPLFDPTINSLPHPGMYAPGQPPIVNLNQYRASQSPFVTPPEATSETSASQSLISALRSTMAPPPTSTRRPLVIPGT